MTVQPIIGRRITARDMIESFFTRGLFVGGCVVDPSLHGFHVFFCFFHFLVHSVKRFGPFYAALIGTSCRFFLIDKWFRSLRSLFSAFRRFFLANGDHCASTESSRAVLLFLQSKKRPGFPGLRFGRAVERYVASSAFGGSVFGSESGSEVRLSLASSLAAAEAASVSASSADVCIS